MRCTAVKIWLRLLSSLFLCRISALTVSCHRRVKITAKASRIRVQVEDTKTLLCMSLVVILCRVRAWKHDQRSRTLVDYSDDDEECKHTSRFHLLSSFSCMGMPCDMKVNSSKRHRWLLALSPAGQPQHTGQCQAILTYIQILNSS